MRLMCTSPKSDTAAQISNIISYHHCTKHYHNLLSSLFHIQIFHSKINLVSRLKLITLVLSHGNSLLIRRGRKLVTARFESLDSEKVFNIATIFNACFRTPRAIRFIKFHCHQIVYIVIIYIHPRNITLLQKHVWLFVEEYILWCLEIPALR